MVLVENVVNKITDLQAAESLPFMEVSLVAVGLVFYAILNSFFWPAAESKIIKLNPFWKSLVFLHNFILAVYSIVTFYNTFLVVRQCLPVSSREELVAFALV